ncbi:MAG: sulfurtransferase [Gammaproteobacteria bacterium]
MMFNTLIDSATLHDHLQDPAWSVVDCRFDLMQPTAGRTAYQAGHIAGAVYADLNQDLSAPVTATSGRHPLPDPQQFAQQVAQWGIGNHSQVVVYDAGNGMYAVRLWWMLRWLGHEAVALLDGGLAAWQAQGLPLTTQPPHPEPARFRPSVQTDSAVGTAQVYEGIRGGSITVVDARAAVRYTGKVEPIDPVAGHIPTALNYPFEANLDTQGQFLTAAQLRARFADLADRAGQVVHMCGSGVTACHNLLAMEIAGLSGSKLYAGSWSEWVRYDENPVATGDGA